MPAQARGPRFPSQQGTCLMLPWNSLTLISGSLRPVGYSFTKIRGLRAGHKRTQCRPDSANLYRLNLELNLNRIHRIDLQVARYCIRSSSTNTLDLLLEISPFINSSIRKPLRRPTPIPSICDQRLYMVTRIGDLVFALASKLQQFVY